jgi:hypothetical protein
MSMKANKKNYISWSLIAFLVLIALIRLGLSPFAVSAINRKLAKLGEIRAAAVKDFLVTQVEN